MTTTEIRIADLVPLAVQYRAMAASVFNNDRPEYERLEAQADRLYSAAQDHGIGFYPLARLDETSASRPAATKPCEHCGKDFEYRSGNARFCSSSCRQRNRYYEQAA